MRSGFLAVLLLAVVANSGCVVSDLSTADRMKNGLVIVLPGIEGRSKYNADIARGLDDGGVPCAIQIFDWGRDLPLGSLVNLMDYSGNQHQAHLIAKRIMTYQDEHPGMPVHLVGHSGGGGLAVLALEALPPERKVSSTLLLAAAISPDYDLTEALSGTEKGIWNFYSGSDIGYLRVGTTIFGTIDRKHTSAAGAVGFERKYAKLHSVAYRRAMNNSGHSGSHTGWSKRQFVALWLAPVINAAGDARAGYQIRLDDRALAPPTASGPQSSALLGASDTKPTASTTSKVSTTTAPR